MICFILGISVCLNIILGIYIFYFLKKEEFSKEEIVDREVVEDFYETKKSNNSIFH